MMATAVLKQFRIFQIFIICILAKDLHGKSFNILKKSAGDEESERVKRGYSHSGGNDFGSSVHVSSDVLQYSPHEHSANLDSENLQVSSHLASSTGNGDPWAASGLSPGYDVWVQPLSNQHDTSSFQAVSSIISKHPISDNTVNTAFSDDSVHTAHFQSPNSQLHTQIDSSSNGYSAAVGIGDVHEHSSLAISDNIDFGNDADVKLSHYAKSYGK